MARSPYMSSPSSPGCELGAAPRLLVDPGLGLGERPPGLVATDDDDAVVVGAHHVARMDHDRPPSTTGTFTEPGVAFTVPWHDT